MIIKKRIKTVLLLATVAIVIASASAVDSDGDGLKDEFETNTGVFVSETDTGTNPLESDTDGDGVGDWYEVYASYTNPNKMIDKPIIPYPLPDPDASTGSTDKPVKVYILSGQSNMVGYGKVAETDPVTQKPFPGTLESLVKIDGKFPNLVDAGGDWTVRNDVRYKGVIRATYSGLLSPKPSGGSGEDKIGPEFGFGHVMGYLHDEPVLIIKAADGGRNLGFEFLPPGSPQYTSTDGYTYAGYGDSPYRWQTGTTPVPSGDAAGYKYDQCFGAVHGVLNNFNTSYPQYAAQGYEIAGFAWWQGYSDQSTTYPERYEFNMVNLIKALRTEFDAPNAPFVLATLAADGGWDTTKASFDTIAAAQLAVSGETGNYPEFAGNVKTIEARGYWRSSNNSPTTAGYHYNHNAETYLLVGDALGRAMVQLQNSFIVDAGDQMVTWSGEPVNLNATIHGDVIVSSYAWSANPDTGVLFDFDNIEDPTVTITKAATDNPYIVTLILTIVDSEDNTVVGTTTINVYDDQCKAARMGMDLAADHPTDLAGDDCITNLKDLAELALSWLNTTRLSQPQIKENQ